MKKRRSTIHATQDQIDRINRLFESGMPKAQIARELNIYLSVVSRLTPSNAPSNKKYSDEQRAEAIRRVEAGETKRSVGKALGIPEARVVSWTKHKKSFSHMLVNVRNDLVRRVQSGEAVSLVARDLGVNIKSAWEYTQNKLRHELTPDETKRVKDAISAGLSAGEVALSVGVPKTSVERLQGKRGGLRPEASSEERRAAVSALHSGQTSKRVSEKYGITSATLKKWYDNAIADGSIVAWSDIPKADDYQLIWMQEQYPDLEAWRQPLVEWLSGETRNLGRTQNAITSFANYLRSNKYTRPEDLLDRRNAVHRNSYHDSIIGAVKDSAKYNNVIIRFLDWLLNKPAFAEIDEEGIPWTSPAFRNPFKDIAQGESIGRSTESNKWVMPYALISQLRRLVAQGPHFKDWTWVQGLLGRLNENGQNLGTDWFPVTEDKIDKSDPDCVWRLRQRINQGPILEMWSPVRWVAILIKLQTTARMGQIRMVDSGEADTYVCEMSHQSGEVIFVQNTGPLALGTVRKPRRQGVVRQSETGGVVLFFNSNKTQDIGKRGEEKGQECPWPRMPDLADDPYYWLLKLRDWQAKYNPINSLVDWRDIPAKRRLNYNMSSIVGAEYPPASFLFRTPEAPMEAVLPVGPQALNSCWSAMQADFENILRELGIRNPDGTNVILVQDGLSKCSLHGLRVSLITHLAMDGGMPIEMLQKVVGHCSFLMTVYYCKPGLARIEEAITGAMERLDQIKDAVLTRDLSSALSEEIRRRVVFNAEDWTTVLPVNPADRNPLGWLTMHDGICLAGGNTGPLDGDSRVPGCHNGGPPSARDRKYHDHVQGGPRNCPRCRWKCAGKHHLLGLVATFNNRAYHLHKARGRAIAAERKRDDLQREQVKAAQDGQPFRWDKELRATERHLAEQMDEVENLGLDIGYLARMIERVMELPDNPDGPTALAVQGDVLTVRQILEDVDSDLLVLSQICADLEFYPEDLDAGTAIYEFADILGSALEREGYPMVFARMSESEKLAATNALMRELERAANPDNTYLARRQVVHVIDRGESLRQLLGINLDKLIPRTPGKLTPTLRLVPKEKDDERRAS